MEEQPITNDDAAREPEEDSIETPATEPAPEEDAPPPEPASPSIEEIVRGEVERRLAEIFPAKHETPRGTESSATNINSEDRLRMGYGSREPHT